MANTAVIMFGPQSRLYIKWETFALETEGIGEEKTEVCVYVIGYVLIILIQVIRQHN